MRRERGRSPGWRGRTGHGWPARVDDATCSSFPFDPFHWRRGRRSVAAERSSELTLATPPPGPTETAPSPRPHDAGAVGTTATSGAPGAQRAPQEGGGSNQRAGSGRGAQRPSRHTHTEQELEVLAHQLYHRIGRHLRRELLVDRERVGFALDLP